MHGLINRALQGFLVDTYGPATWDEVRGQAALPFPEFEAMLQYETELTSRTLDAAAHVLHKDEDGLLEDLGTWLVSHPACEPIRRLLRFGGAGFVDFLNSLGEMPDRARMALPDLDMPEITVTQDEARVFSLATRWVLPGMGAVLRGALRAMADDYGALVLIDPAPAGDGGAERLRIELLEARYATGRDFELGAERT